MAEQIIQGADREITFTVTDSADVAIDLTTLAGYIVILYYKDDVEIQRYSREAKEGFKSLVQTDAANGIFDIKFQSEDTSKLRIGEEVFAEVKVETADVTYDDNTKHDPDTGILIAEVVKSQTEQYTDLTT